MKLLTWENPHFSAERLEHMAGLKTAHYQLMLSNCFRLTDVNHAKANLRCSSARRRTTATMMDNTGSGWKVF